MQKKRSNRDRSKLRSSVQKPSHRTSNCSHHPPHVSTDASSLPTCSPVHATSRTSKTTTSDLVEVQFADLELHPSLVHSVEEVMGYRYTTKVQAMSIPLSLSGNDVLVRAKTGTGKTLAFLLPVLDRVLRKSMFLSGSAAEVSQVTNRGVEVFILSPTRELATQIAQEASLLTSAIRGILVQSVLGGTNIRTDLMKFKQRGLPTVLVATPGRALDLLRNSTSGLASGIKNIQSLILDEADRLLDMGFRPDLEQIFSYLPPPQKRQTLLFSATLPDNIRSISTIALRPDFEAVDCIGADLATHQAVPQFVLVTSLDDQIAALACCLQDAMSEPDFKIIVCFVAARVTQLFSELFSAMGMPVLEIHSRKTQSHRTKVSENFRNTSEVILFSSDVTARGMDFPDVTLVIQVGMPSDRDQYIHRLGRTARGGKGGRGILLLSDFESSGFLPKIADLPMQTLPDLSKSRMDVFSTSSRAAFSVLNLSTKAAAYQAWMGYYNSNLRTLKWGKEDLVKMANHWIVKSLGEPLPPELAARTVGKMGLRNIPGIRVERKQPGRC